MFPLKASTCFNHDPSVLLYHAAAMQAGKASWHVHACRCFNMDHPQYKVSKQSGIPWASGGASSPGELSILDNFALPSRRFAQQDEQGSGWFGYINIIRNQWGWIPWQHQQWPTILDNQEVNPIWIRAHPKICDYVGRSLSSSGNMINSHGWTDSVSFTHRLDSPAIEWSMIICTARWDILQFSGTARCCQTPSQVQPWREFPVHHFHWLHWSSWKRRTPVGPIRFLGMWPGVI